MAAKTQDPDTIAQNLTDQVKEYKEMASNLKKQTKKTKKQHRELAEELDGMREEVTRLESSDGSADEYARKIEILKKKDKEMQDFLGKYPKNVESEYLEIMEIMEIISV